MKRFEYFTFFTNSDGAWSYRDVEYDKLYDILNAFGEDGWELVAIETKASPGYINSPFAFYFKREL